MGGSAASKKGTVAKKRLDKFYYLAKERGYRSRAAFKLLQLDKKYEFLGTATGVVDLCAAPGSWMQVARQFMPKDALCIGIDRAPIKPIPKCVVLQEDITTQKCRAAVKRELKAHGGSGAAINVVLHDGAPNVGTSWLQDAFGQNELTLLALKLAVDVLAPGGTFVTKMFRSADYQSLMWVFGQLFGKVEATKPQASRNESAEIFVVCRGFKAVAIDPKFLDPKHVFSEVDEAEGSKQPNVLQQKKGKKAPAEGYAATGQLLHSQARVVDFVLGPAPVKLLGEVNALVWDESGECSFWRGLKATKPEVLEACSDLKVLNKTELRKLLAWRGKAAAAWEKEQRAAAGGDGEGGNGGDGDAASDSEAEAVREEEEISELQKLADQRAKGAKRRAAEAKAKFRERLALKMEHPGDRLDVQEELELFSLARVRGDGSIAALTEGAAPDEVADVDEDEDEEGGGLPAGGEAGSEEEEEEEGDEYTARLDAELESMHAEYRERTRRRAVHLIEEQADGPKSKKQQREARLDAIRNADVDPEELARQVAAREAKAAADASDDDDDDDDAAGGGESSEDEAEGGGPNSLLVGGPSRSERRTEADARTSRWFQDPLFAGAGEADEDDDAEEIARMAAAARAKRAGKAPEATAGGAAPGGAAGGAADGVADGVAGGAARSKRRRGKRGKATAAADAAAAADAERARSAAEAVARQFSGGGSGEGVPEASSQYVDLEQDGVARKHVGGRFAEYDSEDEDEDKPTHAESAAAAIERQAEAMVLGAMLLRPDKRRRLEDDGYNRHAFADKGLPQWFLDDERRFAHAEGYGEVELPEEQLANAREYLKSINSRTIKKVAEAKARKRRRTERALTKVRKKATALAEKTDVSEREKAKEIAKLYKKKIGTDKKPQKKVVVGKRKNAGPGGKSKSVKHVDARTRSDTRGEKLKAAREKKGISKDRKGRKQHKASAYKRSSRK